MKKIIISSHSAQKQNVSFPPPTHGRCAAINSAPKQASTTHLTTHQPRIETYSHHTPPHTPIIHHKNGVRQTGICGVGQTAHGGVGQTVSEVNSGVLFRLPVLPCGGQQCKDLQTNVIL